jgi:hypothetical protein
MDPEEKKIDKAFEVYIKKIKEELKDDGSEPSASPLAWTKLFTITNPKEMNDIDEDEGGGVFPPEYSLRKEVTLSCPICESPMLCRLAQVDYSRKMDATKVVYDVVSTSCECPTVEFNNEWVHRHED